MLERKLYSKREDFFVCGLCHYYDIRPGSCPDCGTELLKEED